MREQHDIFEPAQTLRHIRLRLEDIKAGTANDAAFESGNQGRFIDDIAARRIDEVSTRFHQRQALRIDQMPIFATTGAVQRHEVRSSQHILDRVQLPGAVAARFRRVDARAVVEDDIHVEAEMTAFGHRLADAAKADDAERLAGDLAADHVGRAPSGPFAGPNLALPLARPARDCKQQRHGNVGGAVGQNTRCVGHDDIGGLGGRDVDVVVADAIISKDLRPEAAAGEEFDRKPIGNGWKYCVRGPERIGQPFGRHRHVAFVQGDVEPLCKHLFHGRRPATGDENAGFRAHVCLRNRIVGR
ncbi:hypothetical protein D9M72_346060 [compost metagenome]